MKPAWIYARYSSLEQAKGLSLERQLTAGRAFIDRMGWEHDPSREIIDEGRSAFKGANRDEGSALYEFERKAREGHFHNGAVLCVESIDRLSRQGAKAAAKLIWALNESGVDVATWFDNHVYKAGVDADMMDLFSIIIKAQVAYEESAKKSKRSQANWNKKRDLIRAGTKTAISTAPPAWLSVDPLTKQFKPIEHRVNVLNEIFDWYIDGLGVPKIVSFLNDRKEPAWGRWRNSTNAGWGLSYIQKLLNHRALLGEYVADGDLLAADHYPQVITAEKFNKAQAVRASRRRSGGSNVNTGKNLFGSIVRCAECGSSATFIGRTSDVRYTTKSGEERVYKRKQTFSYYTCDRARRAHQCTNKVTIRYETLERSILDVLFELAHNGIELRPTDEVLSLRTAIAEHERQISTRQTQLSNIITALAETPVKALAEKAAGLEREIERIVETLKQTVRQLEVAKGKSRPEENLSILTQMRASLTSDDDEVRTAARLKTNQALKGLIKSMEFEPNGETHVVIGDDVLVFTFDKEGKLIGNQVLQTEIIGPDGERNWHPEG